MKKLILLLIMLGWLMPSFAQETRIVTGKVRAFNDLPVSGVKVTATKAQSAVKTDSVGNFSIACYSNDCISIKSECFKTANVKVSSKTVDTLVIKLTTKGNEKAVDVAIGYGYLKEDQRTQAVQSLRKGPDYSSFTSVYDIIKQNFNGVDVRPDGCIVVRGLISANGSSCATFIVNGSEVDSIDYLSTNNIKEISLIKDGTAAIYGNRSAAGVFLITTY